MLALHASSLDLSKEGRERFLFEPWESDCQSGRLMHQEPVVWLGARVCDVCAELATEASKGSAGVRG